MNDFVYLYDAPNVTGYLASGVLCEDLDGDGYYNWGIGQKPFYCPSCSDMPDGNDYNPNIGGMDEMGNSIYLADSFQAPYIDGDDAIGCSGKYVIVNLPEDANVSWSVSSSFLTSSIVDIDGPSTEAMLLLKQSAGPALIGATHNTGIVTLNADFTNNSTPFRLTKSIYVCGDIIPRFGTVSLEVFTVGRSTTINETNCTNVPSQFIKWTLTVPGIGTYTQFGHSVTICPTQSGTVSIKVTNLLSCNPSHGSFMHTARAVNPHFSIVTNPVDAILLIKLSECNEKDSEYVLDITDSTGNTMFKEKVTSESLSISTSLYQKGVYTVRLSCANQNVQIDKFVKN